MRHLLVLFVAFALVLGGHSQEGVDADGSRIDRKTIGLKPRNRHIKNMSQETCRKVLELVRELHRRGYERLRIAPGMSASGMHWRCAITPVSNISPDHGARIVDYEGLAAHYSSADDCAVFGWTEIDDLAPSLLADRFVGTFPEIAAAGLGEDPAYVEWYREMLEAIGADALPIAYADWDFPDDRLPTVGRRKLKLLLPPCKIARSISPPKSMKPTLFSLFKRGKYYQRKHINPLEPGEAPTVEEIQERKELERFAVAAIAFCLQHHDAFLNHFFNAVCRREGDPPLDEWSIDIEPHTWSDLAIYNRSPSGTFVYIVECKIGAGLADHQNPDKKEFAKKGGYGRILEASEPKDAALRYTVLGYRPTLTCSQIYPGLRVVAQQKAWSDIVETFSPLGIALDLFNSLAQLGIPQFAYRHTNTTKMNSQLADAAKAGQVLAHVADRLQILDSYRSVESWWESDKDWCFGLIVRPLPPKLGKSDNQRKLMSLVGETEEEICWFGYEPHALEDLQLSVWFYCKTKKCAEFVEAQLKIHFPDIALHEDKETGVHSVVVSTIKHGEEGDRDWFVSVFERAGIKPVD
jgi:hypothetical protein